MAKRRVEVRQVKEEQALPAPAPEPRAGRTIRVASSDGRPFWEKHPDHQGGEVWAAGELGKRGPSVEVAPTQAVQRALRDGRLVMVEGE